MPIVADYAYWWNTTQKAFFTRQSSVRMAHILELNLYLLITVDLLRCSLDVDWELGASVFVNSGSAVLTSQPSDMRSPCESSARAVHSFCGVFSVIFLHFF